jgi:hypothetical protein
MKINKIYEGKELKSIHLEICIKTEETEEVQNIILRKKLFDGCQGTIGWEIEYPYLCQMVKLFWEQPKKDMELNLIISSCLFKLYSGMQVEMQFKSNVMSELYDIFKDDM